MDKSSQESYIARLEAQKVEALRQHVAAFEALETQHGLDLDALTDIHGGTVFDPEYKRSTDELLFWQELYAAINSGNRYIALVDFYKGPSPVHNVVASDGPRYKLIAQVSIFDQPLTDASIVTKHVDEGAGYTEIEISGASRVSFQQNLVNRTDAPIVLASSKPFDFTDMVNLEKRRIFYGNNPTSLVSDIDSAITARLNAQPYSDRMYADIASFGLMLDWATNEKTKLEQGADNG